MSLTSLLTFILENQSAIASILLFLLSEYLGSNSKIKSNSIYDLFTSIIRSILEAIKNK
jgi:hypothetical protein